MIRLVSFQYEVNALYVISVLKEKGIIAKVAKRNKGEAKVFDIRVHENLKESALLEIGKLSIDDTASDPYSEGYLEEYSGWAKRTTNIFAFRGGKKAPHFANKSYIQVFVPFLIVGGLLFIFFLNLKGDIWPEIIICFGLYIILASLLIKQLVWHRKRK